MVELRQCLSSIEPPRSTRRRPEAVRCPSIVKSTPLLRQTASIVASLDCADFELTNHIAYRVENKSLISTAGKLIFQVREYT